MKERLILLVFAAGCGATTPPAFYGQCLLLDRVAAAAKAGSPTQSVALEILERVAEGRMDDANPELETKVGLMPGQLRGRWFQDHVVRVHALRRIGQLDLPEALTYLQGLKQSTFVPDTSSQLWAAAQTALHEALFNRITNEPERIRFLEHTAETSAAGSWAMNELCNRGSYPSLPLIRARIQKVYSLSPASARLISFCEGRMEIVSRSPDRVKALGSYLDIRTVLSDQQQLIEWAIGELQAIKTPQAKAELERFADEIDELPDGSARKEALLGKRVAIRGVLP